MKSMPHVDESRKRKADTSASYGKKSKTDPSVLAASRSLWSWFACVDVFYWLVKQRVSSCHDDDGFNSERCIFGRLSVRRFALCYPTVVLSVCLSVLSVTLVHCGEIKMKLGMQVGLGTGHVVLDGYPAPPVTWWNYVALNRTTKDRKERLAEIVKNCKSYTCLSLLWLCTLHRVPKKMSTFFWITQSWPVLIVFGTSTQCWRNLMLQVIVNLSTTGKNVIAVQLRFWVKFLFLIMTPTLRALR